MRSRTCIWNSVMPFVVVDESTRCLTGSTPWRWSFWSIWAYLSDHTFVRWQMYVPMGNVLLLYQPSIRVFTVRRYALHGLSYRNSVRLSVRLSVTLVHCVHMVLPTIMMSSPYGSPIILVSGDITIIPKFEGGHSERGRWMRVGWVRIGDFRPISRRISETVRDTTKVTINH